MAITNPQPGQLVRDDYDNWGIVLQVTEDGTRARLGYLQPQHPSEEWPLTENLFPAT